EYPKEVPYNKATSMVIEIILERGVSRVSGGKRLMINVPMDFLINKALESLDPQKLIIEVIEPQISIGDILYKQLVSSIDKYTQKGVLFSMNEKCFSNNRMKSLFEKMHIISVDVDRLDSKVVQNVKIGKKQLLILKIQDDKDYKKAIQYGDLMQGLYLEGPIPLGESQTAPYLKSTLFRLIKQVYTAKSPKELAELIAMDVGMTAKVLRFVNSAYYSPLTEIKSIEQACAIMGLKALRNFVLALAMNDQMSTENLDMWKKSLLRAIIAQKIAEIISPKYESEAYLIGLFSLIDEILNVDKITFISEIKIGQDVIDGYTGRNQTLKKILDYSIELEELSQASINEQNGSEDNIIANLEESTGIKKQRLLDIIKYAFDTVEAILKV
ncbi:MAG: HDOD domain-containing protein, partial [Aquificaceae bacterium]|nr:HDOD domain-containing protein [Aquificaceae bacterium]